MLVVISDLHLCDGSASENVEARAFDLFLDHVTDLAEHAGARKVTLLLLGDVFDLLRTEHWFYPAPGEPLDRPAPRHGEPFPLEDRPWASRRVIDDPGALSAACRERALQIVRKIRRVCGPQLDLLAGRPVEAEALGDTTGLRERVAAKVERIEIDRVFLPGNHDRLARVLPEVLRELLDALGARLPTADELAAPGFLRLAPAVVARHGHELDPWNFEPVRIGTATPTDADFLRTPLGDPLTTEVLAGLPFRVRQDLLARVEAGAASPAERGGDPPEPPWIRRIHRHLQGIEDVRPLGAVVRWVVLAGRHVREIDPGHADEVRAVLNKVARERVDRLVALAFTRAWLRRRLFRRGFGAALALLGAWLASKLVPLCVVERVLEWRLVRALLERGGDAAQAALAEGLLRGAGGTYAVLGHTHAFRHVPLGDPPGGPVQVYLNSGTWRPRVYEVRDRTGFAKVRELTYLVFREGAVPTYEAWNGIERR